MYILLLVYCIVLYLLRKWQLNIVVDIKHFPLVLTNLILYLVSLSTENKSEKNLLYCINEHLLNHVSKLLNSNEQIYNTNIMD